VNNVASADEKVLEIDGHELHISHPDKVFFSEHGETKLDLVNHYLRFAEPLMRTMGGRPTLMQRFPEGAGGSSFFQKRVPKSAPDWLQTTIVSTPNGTTSRALVAVDLAHVLWAVNIGCLGFHVWPYLADDPEHADELRLDLDPQPGNDFTHIRAAAARVRAGCRFAVECSISQFCQAGHHEPSSGGTLFSHSSADGLSVALDQVSMRCRRRGCTGPLTMPALWPPLVRRKV